VSRLRITYAAMESRGPATPAAGRPSLSRAAIASCHVERPLDDGVWRLVSKLLRGGTHAFPMLALMRPPEKDESETKWLDRARFAAAAGTLGHHTHYVSATTARPEATTVEHARLVERQATWMRDAGLTPTVFCGGGWYVDERILEVISDFGYSDCTATGFRPRYLANGATRLSVSEPVRIKLSDSRSVLEFPATHSLGMAVRAILRGELPSYRPVHVYFHDTDLVSRARRVAIMAVLSVLSRTRQAVSLDELVPEVAMTARSVSVRDVLRNG
jgi:hypothetical protein